MKTPQPRVKRQERADDSNNEDQCLTVEESDLASEFEENSNLDQYEDEYCSEYSSPKRKPNYLGETPEQTIDT